MPSTYTTSLRLTLPATGELAGTWGTTVNAGVTSLAEAAIAGTAAVTMIDADYTLTAVNGSADQARNMFVTLTGTLSAARNVICPPVSKLYFVTNNTTGGYAITFKTLSGTGISVPNGQRAVLYCNGTDVLGGLTALDSLSLNGSLTLVGGTANGVVYLNGSKVVTTGASLTFDGTNLGVGTGSPGAKLDVRGNATFTGNATARQTADFTNTGGQLYVGTESSAGGAVFTGASAYAGILGTNNNTPLQFASNGSVRATLDATGNLGLGVTPSAWSASYKAYELPAGAVWSVSPTSLFLTSNAYNNGTNYIYKTSNAASQYQQGAGAHTWSVAASGTAGATFSFTTAMTLTAAGNLGIGTSSPVAATGTTVDVAGASGASQRWRNNAGTSSAYLEVAAGVTNFGNVSSTPITFITAATERMRLTSSGNLGLGVTPSASWPSGTTAIQFGPSSALYNPGSGSRAVFASNAVFTSGVSSANYITSNAAAFYDQSNGTHSWHTAPSGTAGNSISFTQAMVLDASSRLFVGTTSGAAGFNLISGANAWFTVGATSASVSYGAFYKGGTTTTTVGYLGTDGGGILGGGSGDNFGIRAENALLFMSGAAERARLDASGNLGIGTNAPGYRLSVAGTAGSAVLNLLETGVRSWAIRAGGAATNTFDISDLTAGQTRLTLDSSGNLGIGTASPDVFSRGDTRTVGVSSSGTSSIGINAATGNAASLYVGVNGTRSGQIVGSSAGLEVIAGSSLPLSLGANFSTRVTISSAGNVGVGTASPTSTLHVSGSFSRGAPVTKTANFTLADTENWVIVNNSTSSVTATLPAPSSFPGRELMFVARYATGGGNLVSASSNVVQPDGTVTAVIIPYDVSGRYKFATIVSDGTNWVVMNRGIM